MDCELCNIRKGKPAEFRIDPINTPMKVLTRVRLLLCNMCASLLEFKGTETRWV